MLLKLLTKITVYSEFVYCTNLTKLTEYRCNQNMTIQPTDITLLIFGEDPRVIGLESAFEQAFSYEKNVKIWADIGLNPFNRHCLQGECVKYEVIMDKKWNYRCGR